MLKIEPVPKPSKLMTPDKPVSLLFVRLLTPPGGVLSVSFSVSASAYLATGSAVITVARLVGNRNSEGEASASIILIAFEFGLSIFTLV